MANDPERLLTQVAGELQRVLGGNLRTCAVYGSYARGNALPGSSDLNLLLVLERSDAAAHTALAEALAGRPQVDPLIVEAGTLRRTARCFANKFASIQRNYRVLCGADPFADLQQDLSLERLLCEQALRNVRLRMSYAFVMNGRSRRYVDFLGESVSAVFVQLSDVLRLSGQEVEKDFSSRIPAMVAAWKVDPTTLEQLLELRADARTFKPAEAATRHQRMLDLLDTVLAWMEANWTETKATP